MIPPRRKWESNNPSPRGDVRLTQNEHNIHNAVRACRALRALRHHKSRERHDGELLLTEDLVHLLVDLRHLCERWFENARDEPYTGGHQPEGLDPDELWARASALHAEEVRAMEESLDEED